MLEALERSHEPGTHRQIEGGAEPFRRCSGLRLESPSLLNSFGECGKVIPKVFLQNAGSSVESLAEGRQSIGLIKQSACNRISICVFACGVQALPPAEGGDN